ncbi:MAG: kelch repeat-containing protein [Pseudomonadota bacterium]
MSLIRGPAEIERYDPATDRWTIVSTFPDLDDGRARDHVTAGHAVWQSQIWYTGGKHGPARGPTGSVRVDVFDTATLSWRRGPDMPARFWGHGTAVLDDKLHVISGGVGGGSVTDQHYVLDLSDEASGWNAAAPVPFPQVHTAAVALQGRIYLIGGETAHSGHRGINARVQEYNPISNSWRSRAQLPQARSHHEWATFAWNDRIISAGGIGGSNPVRAQTEIYQFFPQIDRWELIGHMEKAFVSPGAKLVDGWLYTFGGGIGGFFPATAETWVTAVDFSPPDAVFADGFEQR